MKEPASHVDVTLRLRMSLGVSPPAGLAETITRWLHEYTDGRHLFSVELIHEGVKRLVENCLHIAIEQDLRSKYPYCEAAVSGRGSTIARRGLEDVIGRDISVHVLTAGSRAGIEVVLDPYSGEPAGPIQSPSPSPSPGPGPSPRTGTSVEAFLLPALSQIDREIEHARERPAPTMVDATEAAGTIAGLDIARKIVESAILAARRK